MNTKMKNIVLIVLTALVIFGFSLWCLFGAKETYSMSERRTLALAPEVSLETVTNGRFMTQFEEYYTDHFPMRDTFRTVKAMSSMYIFGKKDNHDLYTVKDVMTDEVYLSKMEYPENPQRLEASSKKLQEVYEKFIKDTDCKMYLSLIPDKNYFMAPMGGYPTMDYEGVVEKFRNELSFAEYIDVFPKLSLSDYYHTDQHWKQECVYDVAEKVASGLGVSLPDEQNYEKVYLDVPFYGAYVGQISLPFDPDQLVYLTSDELESVTVTSYNTGMPKEAAVYDLQKAEGRDGYEMFLGGSDPLLTIDNPNASSDKELVIFRDSFGSSLVPLLVPGYRKITVVDLRYVQSAMLGAFIKFDKQDVLYMYSTLILNNTISQ